MPVLRYGTDSSVRLEFAEGVLLQECGNPRGESLDDLSAATAAALDQPLEFPSLSKSATPGDRIVLALDRGIPQVAQITAAVIHSLVTAGVDPDGICVLRTPADVETNPENPCRLINKSLGRQIEVMTHQPEDRNGLAYLAATEAGEPIFLNRLLTDADLVLPIGCIQGEAVAGYFGIHTPIFPGFSDEKTLARYRGLDSLPSTGHRRRELAREVDEVAWLLGITFTIQLVPAAGEGVLHVLAGLSSEVHRRGRELYRAAWSSPVARRASLVVAAIEGGGGQQTWENLGRALEAADALVEEGGAIAVCCDLATAPGPAVQCMVGAQSRAEAMRQIRKVHPVDALPAAQLAHALRRDHVYLLSRLDPSLVEELEMVPLEDPSEINRLARQHRSCILLANAPHAIARVEEE